MCLLFGGTGGFLIWAPLCEVTGLSVWSRPERAVWLREEACCRAMMFPLSRTHTHRGKRQTVLETQELKSELRSLLVGAFPTRKRRLLIAVVVEGGIKCKATFPPRAIYFKNLTQQGVHSIECDTGDMHSGRSTLCPGLCSLTLQEKPGGELGSPFTGRHVGSCKSAHTYKGKVKTLWFECVPQIHTMGTTLVLQRGELGLARGA